MQRRGETGVGTLIIFIALLAVASITATVIIQATSTTQQRAVNVGGQATRTVATRVDVVQASAADGRSSIENLTFTAKLGPGSGAIDLNALLLTLDTHNTTTLYYYSASTMYTVNASAQNGTFGVTYLERGNAFEQDILSRGDLVSITFQAPRAIRKDEEIRVKFVPAASMPTTLKISLPHTIYTERVHLYP
jgi:archaeal flagellin FlaB